MVITLPSRIFAEDMQSTVVAVADLRGATIGIGIDSGVPERGLGPVTDVLWIERLDAAGGLGWTEPFLW